MKHSAKVTSMLVLLFIFSQIIGLIITNQYVKTVKTPTGEIVEIKPLPYDIERPPTQGAETFIYIMIAILIATLIIFFLVKFKKTNLWRAWFLLAIFLTLTIAFGAFLPQGIAGVLAIILALWKIYKPGLIIQNLTEVFVYAGLAAIFVPVLTLFWAFMLLIAISLYDMVAVWKTKHMIKLAKFQTKSKIFAGLLIPYKVRKGATKGKAEKGVKIEKAAKIKTAVLGGGDMGIPLIFAGVVLKSSGMGKAFIVSLFAAIALTLLLIKAEKGKFYPAMPFISIGCILGYVITLII